MIHQCYVKRLDLNCEENAGSERLIVEVELLKLQESGQLPDDPVRGLDLSCKEIAGSERLIVEVELLKLQESGQFPDDPVKVIDSQTHSGSVQTY